MDAIEWEKIYLQLYAYADQLLKAHRWFRGKNTDSYLEGRQPHDYVMDAIEKYLNEPEKYDPSHNRSLVNYLKLHLIRSAVGNDSKKVENIVSSNIFNKQESENEDDVFLDAMLPCFNDYFDQQIDLTNILNDVFNSIKEDTLVLKIFEGCCRNRLKRREVIEEYKMTEAEYDNGFKRLRTILKNTAKKFELIKVK
jgi:hypothetical protein